MTEDEMRSFLARQKVSVPVGTAYDKLVATYHQYKSNNDNVFANAISEVQSPVLPASTLHASKIYDPSSEIKPILTDPETFSGQSISD